MQPAACGLCLPATGGTGAAASCGVARAASRDDRERPTVPLGTAQSRRTCASGCVSAGLLALAATGELIGHYCAGFIRRRARQGRLQVMAYSATTPPRPLTMSAPLFSSLNISTFPTITSTRGGRDSISLPHAPHTLARSDFAQRFVVARARDSNLIAPPPCFSRGLSSGFCRRRLSRAHSTHVLLSTAQRRGSAATSAARVRARCARRGSSYFSAPTSGSRAPARELKRQLC